MITILRNRKPDAYRIIPKIPRYYAFHVTTTDLLATIYASDGTWLADRGTIPLPANPPAADNGVLIPRSSGEGAPSPAPRGRVGEGAFAWRSGPNELTVWDVANATLHTYQTAAEVTCCSPPVVHEGRLFWVEFPPHQTEPDPTAATLTLRHAACDLSDPQTLASVVLPFGVDRWDLGPRAKVAAGPGALLVEARWQETINHEGNATVGARFPFTVSGAAEAGGVLLDLEQGFAAADGTSVGMLANENSLRAHSLSLGVPSEARWPATGPWAFYIALNVAVTADGATALLYGGVEEEFDPIVLEAPSTATDGEPAIRVSITSHPVRGIPPHLLFFLESI